jgi:hypothetical protein
MLGLQFGLGKCLPLSGIVYGVEEEKITASDMVCPFTDGTTFSEF